MIEKLIGNGPRLYAGATLHLRHVMNAFACIIMQSQSFASIVIISQKKNSSKTNEIDEMWVDEKSCVI